MPNTIATVPLIFPLKKSAAITTATIVRIVRSIVPMFFFIAVNLLSAGGAYIAFWAMCAANQMVATVSVFLTVGSSPRKGHGQSLND